MSAKAHLAVSATPIRSGQDVMALCGAIVVKAEFVAMAEENREPNSLDRLCRNCRAIQDRIRRRYEWAIICGQEQRDGLVAGEQSQ